LHTVAQIMNAVNSIAAHCTILSFLAYLHLNSVSTTKTNYCCQAMTVKPFFFCDKNNQI